LALNAYIVRELFTAEYIAQMGSIEATHIAIARMPCRTGGTSPGSLVVRGIPYQNTYLPLLHLIVAAAAKLLGISPAHSYHAVTAAFYCLGRSRCSGGLEAYGFARLQFRGRPGLLSLLAVGASDLLRPAGHGQPVHPRRFETLVRSAKGRTWPR